MRQQTKQKLYIALGVCVFLTLLLWLAFSGDNFALLKSLFTQELSDDELRARLTEFGWRGHVFIVALATMQVVCAFLPAEPVQVLGGFTFGFAGGLLLCMLGVVIGNTVVYLLQKLYGDRLRGFFIKKWNLDLEAIQRSGKCVFLIFLLYFLPAIPYGMICFFAATTGMRYRRFIAVTVLGALPSVCIGVGLGYITITSSWVISVSIFTVLLALLAVMFWKKDVLFAKLNRYADANKKRPKNAVKPVNGALMTVLYFGARAYLALCGVRVKTENRAGRIETPSIVLCNHGSFIDFIYAAVLLRKYKPHFVVARLYFYHSLLGGLLRAVGAFPKSMFATDLESTRNCLTVLKNGELLAMMPEARLSTAGRFEDIQPSTYSFLKKAGVPVYTVSIRGDYLADPKWGKGFRRGSLVEAVLEPLFTAEHVQTMPTEQLQQAVEERLHYDEFAWLRTRPNVHYRDRCLAQGLENILNTCPRCGGKHTLYTRGTEIGCSECGRLTALSDRYAFDDGFAFAHLADWFDWQCAQTEKEIRGNAEYALSSEVELRLPSIDGKRLTRHGGRGVCTLDRNGLTYVGTKDGETVELTFTLSKIYRLLFGAGENFEVYDGTEILYFVPTERRSAVDWYIASRILYACTCGGHARTCGGHARACGGHARFARSVDLG